MKIRLFDIDVKGRAKITTQVKMIEYLSCLLDEYGEDTALKLFQVFDKVYDLNPETNPYANLREDIKYETIVRTMYPDLESEVDLDDEKIERALDLVEELYETPKYRAYKSLKILYDTVVVKMKHAEVVLTKKLPNSI